MGGGLALVGGSLPKAVTWKEGRELGRSKGNRAIIKEHYAAGTELVRAPPSN